MLNLNTNVRSRLEAWVRKPEASSAVFAVGRLGLDFGCVAQRDSFLHRLGCTATHPVSLPGMAEHLRDHPEDAHGLTWTLTLDGTPVYALESVEPFSAATTRLLIRLLLEQEKDGGERITLAGCVAGPAFLLNGTAVHKVIPVMRSIATWNIGRFTERCLGEFPPEEASEERERYEEQQANLHRFVHLLSRKVWNLGAAVRDRAANFAIAHAFRVGEVFVDAFREHLVLDTVTVEGSPSSRPGSECWDVKLRFQDPASRSPQARKVYRYTVDVNDSIPSIVGGLHTRFEF